MELPNFEPYDEEERVQASWDSKCDRAPHCYLCGESVLPGEYYVELNGMVYCENCIEAAKVSTEYLEV